MIRILLIRHGSTDLLGRVLYGRMPGVHLNAEGVRQSQEVAARLKEEFALAGIITSPMERAVQTAEPLAKAQGKQAVIDPALTEVDFGEWVGKSFEELAAFPAWKDFNRRRALYKPPGGESMMEVQARAWAAIQSAAQEFPKGEALALVTHGDVVRCILLLALGAPIDHIHRLEIAPASVSEILVGEHGPIVRAMNQIFY